MRRVFKENVKMRKSTSEHRKILIVADIDISRNSGDTCRTLAFASNLAEDGFTITLLIPKPKSDVYMINCNNIKLEFITQSQRESSFLNLLRRRIALIKNAKRLKDNNIIIIETSVLGGYFALFGFSDYILDMHGLSFDEIQFVKLPWYLPNIIWQKITYFLELLSVKKSSKIIVVSNSMLNFITNKWNINANKIEVIHNGYFDNEIEEINNMKLMKEKGMVTFVGVLARWANIEKILFAAKHIENANFYIVGPIQKNYQQELAKIIKEAKIKNVIFTGSVPLKKAYELIAKSEIVLLPFPRSLCTEVAWPIKITEYMALKKPIIIDNVGDISDILREKNAALICDPNNWKEFLMNIKILLHNDKLKEQISHNSKILAKEYSWKNNCKKLINLLKNQQYISIKENS